MKKQREDEMRMAAGYHKFDNKFTHWTGRLWEVVERWRKATRPVLDEATGSVKVYICV